MTKIITICVVSLNIVTLCAQNIPTNVSQIIERSTGGIIVTTFKGTKDIYYVNAQSKASDQLIEEARKKMELTLKTPIKIKSGIFSFPYPKIEGELTLFIINDENMPLSLVAPEGRWAFVNVAPLAKDRGVKKQFFEARVKKEMARIACILFGNMGSSYKRNLLSFIGSAEELDKFESDNLPIDGPMRCTKYLLSLGVRPFRRVSYRKACEEGWAHNPTNNIQEAIWNEVHAAPKNPMKIEFDPKKGR